MERSPALAARVGPLADADRLNQRLADAAVMAGRMAHDFNNVLTGILGFADLTLPLLTPNTQPAKYVAEILKVGRRGIQFTQQLHQFSRSGQAEPLAGQLPQCLAREEARIRAAAPGTAPIGVQVRIDAPAACPPVGLDNGPLSAILGHLLDNAVEASPPHGVVQVTARPVDLTAADARVYLGRASAGPHVEVTIQDDGPASGRTCGRGCSPSRSSRPRSATAGWDWPPSSAPCTRTPAASAWTRCRRPAPAPPPAWCCR